MVNWNMVAGAAGSGDGVLSLEDNLSNRVPKGAQMVIQAHYINTTGKPFTTKDAITLKLRKPGETADYVNYFAVFDGSFQIPPQTKYTSTTECTGRRRPTARTFAGAHARAGQTLPPRRPGRERRRGENAAR